MRNRKRILDAGTGLVCEAIEFGKADRKGDVFEVDLSNAVDAAYLNTKQFSNIHIIQADLMKFPFKRGTFDFVFSEGVLHHTPETREAFQRLLNVLAPPGGNCHLCISEEGADS